MNESLDIEQFLEGVFTAEGPEGVANAFSFLYGAFVITRNGQMVGANDDFLRLIEYDRSELYNLSAFDVIPAEEHDAMHTRFQDDDIRHYELKILTKSGTVKHALVTPKVLLFNNQKYRFAEFIDITEQTKLKEKLHLSDEIFSTTPDMLASLDADGNYLAANNAYASAFGLNDQDITGRNVRDIFNPEFFGNIIAPNIEKTRQGSPVRYQEWFEFPVTGKKYMDILYSPLYEQDGRYKGFIVNGRDITDLKRAEEKIGELNTELSKLSFLDGLTGIANRRFLDLTLAREWNRARRNKNSIAIIMGDIDFFKQYNDYYGHLAGDDCLKKLASTLNNQVNRSTDLVARFGGEEFVILLPDTTKIDAIDMAKKCRRAIHGLGLPHANSSISSIVTMSFGVTAQIPEEDSFRTFIDTVDKLLYQAKANGRDRIE